MVPLAGTSHSNVTVLQICSLECDPMSLYLFTLNLVICITCLQLFTIFNLGLADLLLAVVHSFEPGHMDRLLDAVRSLEPSHMDHWSVHNLDP